MYDLNTKKTDNITEENKGYDTNPQYSPDGKYIAWQSMERDGYEADLNRLFIMNLETGEKRFVSKAFESNVDAFIWEMMPRQSILQVCGMEKLRFTLLT